MRDYPLVRHTMDTRTHAVRPGDDVLSVVGTLVDRGVTGAPVINHRDEVIGMISEAECLRLLTHGVGGEGAPGNVGEIMRTDFETVSPDMDIYYVAGRFLAHPDERRFPVVEEGRLVGVITRKDILRAVRGMLTRQV